MFMNECVQTEKESLSSRSGDFSNSTEMCQAVSEESDKTTRPVNKLLDLLEASGEYSISMLHGFWLM